MQSRSFQPLLLRNLHHLPLDDPHNEWIFDNNYESLTSAFMDPRTVSRDMPFRFQNSFFAFDHPFSNCICTMACLTIAHQEVVRAHLDITTRESSKRFVWHHEKIQLFSSKKLSYQVATNTKHSIESICLCLYFPT